jgi:peroxiredoxin Q/BCP
VTASVPQPGQTAPEVVLPDADGVVHRLTEQRGRWVVLYFYPKDDTPGCTTEACGFRDAGAGLAERGAVVWGVSPQGTASKAAFRDKYALEFPLLIDADHALAEAYGSWVEKQQYGRTFMGVARRTFLIDPHGRIARTWEKVSPDGHAADVLAAIDAANVDT